MADDAEARWRRLRAREEARAEEGSPWYWLRWAILAEHFAVSGGIPPDEARAVLATKSPRELREAVQGSLVHAGADRLDDEREGAVPVHLGLRRHLRAMRDVE